MVSRYRGDCNNSYSHGLHEIMITESQAKVIAKSICEYYNVTIPTIIFTGRKTKRNLGKYLCKAETIKLQEIGESIGCLIHELAHHIAKYHYCKEVEYNDDGDDCIATPISIKTHGLEFKNTQRMIIQYVKTHMEEIKIVLVEHEIKEKALEESLEMALEEAWTL